MTGGNAAAVFQMLAVCECGMDRGNSGKMRKKTGLNEKKGKRKNRKKTTKSRKTLKRPKCCIHNSFPGDTNAKGR